MAAEPIADWIRPRVTSAPGARATLVSAGLGNEYESGGDMGNIRSGEGEPLALAFDLAFAGQSMVQNIMSSHWFLSFML